MDRKRTGPTVVLKDSDPSELVTLDVRVGDVIVIARSGLASEAFDRIWRASDWERVDIQRVGEYRERIIMTFFEPENRLGVVEMPHPCVPVKPTSRGGFDAKR
jgi:hypothetical protein